MQPRAPGQSRASHPACRERRGWTPAGGRRTRLGSTAQPTIGAPLRQAWAKTPRAQPRPWVDCWRVDVAEHHRDAGIGVVPGEVRGEGALAAPSLAIDDGDDRHDGPDAADPPENGPAPNVTARRRAREGINCSLDWNTRQAARKARTAPQIGPTTAPRRFRREDLARPVWRRRWRVAPRLVPGERLLPRTTTIREWGFARSETTGGCSRSSASKASRPVSAGSPSSTSAPRSGVRSPISTLPGSPASAPATSSGCSAMRGSSGPPRQDRIDDRQRKAGARLAGTSSARWPPTSGASSRTRAPGRSGSPWPPCAAGVPAEAVALSKDLRLRDWSFVGPTTVHAFMQAMGLINDHLEGCHARPLAEAARAARTPGAPLA